VTDLRSCRFTRLACRLLRDREVAVDDADAALLGHGDGRRDSVTVSMAAEMSGYERDVAGELVCVLTWWDDLAVGGDEEDIVEGEGFGIGEGSYLPFWLAAAWNVFCAGFVIVESSGVRANAGRWIARSGGVPGRASCSLALADGD